eukprot:COSAG01_NODE_65414_length_273_cov_0.873563_1_plen_29_part_01
MLLQRPRIQATVASKKAQLEERRDKINAR